MLQHLFFVALVLGAFVIVCKYLDLFDAEKRRRR
jgi:hypothetical protein